MWLRSQLPYAPAYPVQNFAIYSLTNDQPPDGPSSNVGSDGGRAPTNPGRPSPISSSKQTVTKIQNTHTGSQDNNLLLLTPSEEQTPVQNQNTNSLPGSQDSSEQSSSAQSIQRKNPEIFKLMSRDKYGRVILGDDHYNKLNIQEAKELDLRHGGNQHKSVTEVLNKEYRLMLQALDKRDEYDFEKIGFDAHHENTGFWIFGTGHAYVLGREFSDSYHKAKYITKIIMIYFACLVWRSIWLKQILLEKQVHDYLFEQKVYEIPLLVMILTYILLTAIVTSKSLEKFTRQLPCTICLFLMTELVRTVIYCFFSLACQYCIVSWYDTLDIYMDYDPHDETDRNHWKELNITPPIFLLIMSAGLAINIFTALCLEVYTDMNLGTPEMLRATILTSFMTFIVTLVLVKSFSVGIIPMWDGFQVVLGSCLSIIKTWVFLYNLQRLVAGKITHLEGTKNKDVIFGLMIIS